MALTKTDPLPRDRVDGPPLTKSAGAYTNFVSAVAIGGGVTGRHPHLLMDRYLVRRPALAGVSRMQVAEVVRPLRLPSHLGVALPSRRPTRRNNMIRIVEFVNSLRRREEGQDLLEYALLIALIALVCIVAVTAAGVKVEAVFNAITAAIPA
jgi:pilus assembly protein Flp/PilA